MEGAHGCRQTHGVRTRASRRAHHQRADLTIGHRYYDQDELPDDADELRAEDKARRRICRHMPGDPECDCKNKNDKEDEDDDDKFC